MTKITQKYWSSESPTGSVSERWGWRIQSREC